MNETELIKSSINAKITEIYMSPPEAKEKIYKLTNQVLSTAYNFGQVQMDLRASLTKTLNGTWLVIVTPRINYSSFSDVLFYSIA